MLPGPCGPPQPTRPRIAPPTEVAWQQIQRRAARRHWRQRLARVAAIVVPVFAAGGIATGAIEAYAPASRPSQVVVVPPPATTVVVPTTLPASTTVPVTRPRDPATNGHHPTFNGHDRRSCPHDQSTPRGASTPLTAVPWASINYPFTCGTTLQGAVGYKVVQVAYPQTAPGRKVALSWWSATPAPAPRQLPYSCTTGSRGR